MYLTLAEALTELNDDPNALKTLNYLRSNRYVNFTSPNETGTALKNAIALERRLELSFEGDRFFELKRKGLDIVRWKEAMRQTVVESHLLFCIYLLTVLISYCLFHKVKWMPIRIWSRININIFFKIITL